MNHIPFDPEAFGWKGIEPRDYKHGEGDFTDIVRHTLAKGEGLELRYFELAPGGYSSLEKHAHEHFVVVLRGEGRALVGSEIVTLAPFDALYVPPMTPHRFINEGGGPFGFLCPVDAARDRPQPLDETELQVLRSDPATARYVP